MVIPLLVPVALGASALASALTGLKKGWDAKQNFATAGALNKEAENAWKQAAEKLEARRLEVAHVLCRAAELRVMVNSKSMLRFAELMDQIAKTDFAEVQINGQGPVVDVVPMPDIRQANYEALELLKHGFQSGVAGTLVGAGLGQAVGMFGAASTGAAISGLSGAAATNATLAWLGGGSLASGGLGMAGGTVVLGGVVAGPILMVMGYLAAGKSEQALTQALRYSAGMDTAIEQLTSFSLVLNAIETRARELIAVLRAVDERFISAADRVSRMIGRSRRAREDQYAEAGKRIPASLAQEPIAYSELTDEDRDRVVTMVALGSTLYRINKVELIDKDGRVTESSQTAIQEAKNIVEAV